MSEITFYIDGKYYKLSDRHRKLVDYYFLTNFNKREAARLAGYPHPDSYSDRLFKKPDVVAEIDRRRKEEMEKFELTREWIIERLMRLADSNITLSKFKKVDEDGQLYWDFTGASEEELKVIQGISTETVTEGKGKNAKWVKKFKPVLVDPKAALDSLARIQGMFNDKISVEGEVSLIDRIEAGRKRAAQETVESD